jgi:intracellular sulfur oxidation DsrE/DsrF family protein
MEVSMVFAGNWNVLAEKPAISRAIAALQENGIEAVLANSSIQAKAMVLEMLPAGAEVMTMASRTLEETGIADAINGSGNYDAVKTRLNTILKGT